MITEGEDVSAKVSYDTPVEGVGQVRVGAELFRASMDDYWPAVPGSMMMSPLDYVNINDGERNRTGVWAEWEASPAPEWSTLLGMRYERVEMDTGEVQPYSWTSMMSMPDAMAAMAFNAADRAREDDNIDVTAKATWRPSDSVAVEFGAAQKTRSPNLYERYAWGRGSMSSSMTNMTGDGAGYVGDINLEPEVARSLAATLDWTDGARSGRVLRLSAWASYVEDYIDADRIGSLKDGLPMLQFANHEAELYGLEATGAMPLWQTGYGDTRFTGTVSWAKGENKDTGDNLYNIAPLQGLFALENTKGVWTQALELELVDEKDDISAVRQELRTPGYVLIHLRAGGEIGRVRFAAAIENLLDLATISMVAGSARSIRSLAPAGRSISASTSHSDVLRRVLTSSYMAGVALAALAHGGLLVGVFLLAPAGPTGLGPRDDMFLVTLVESGRSANSGC